MSRMRWNLALPSDPEAAKLFPEYDPIIVQLLWNRGLRTQAAVDEFLLPDYGQDLHDPFIFKDMTRACERVWSALAKKEKIVVYSDYDADGVTGAAILISTFRMAAAKLGLDPALVSSYIPHREKEGYGVKAEAVKQLLADGMNLLVTVDCGIGSAAEIALARASGVDAIVVDHHQVPAELPEAIILHPGVPGEPYPFKFLAAAGVAFKFAAAFIAFAGRHGAAFEPGFEKWLLDLVAIATVTDFMPLVGENRTLEKYGLIVLNKTRRPGLRRLVEVAGLRLGALDTTSVGWQIGPRLNAASRMSHGRLAFEALMAEDEAQATALAEDLNRTNVERQKCSEAIAVAARRQVEERGARRIQILAGEGWPAGVVGLIAGKLAGELGVPVFIFSRDGEKFVGSGRGVPGFDVMVGLNRAKDSLLRYGGHPQACGLTIDGEGNYRSFCETMEACADEVLAGRDLRPTLEVDAAIRVSQADWKLIEWLEKFEPFGEGNQRPKFLLRDLLVASVEPVGQGGKHVRIGVRGDLPRETKMIGFNLATVAANHPSGSRIDAVVEVGVNVWNGNKSIQLKIVDLRAAGAAD